MGSVLSNTNHTQTSPPGSQNPVNIDIELLKCPICISIPQNDVYQCQNGHIVCGNCAANLEKCPQCRVAIEGNLKSRNRVLEALMDNIKVECPFAEAGCKETIKRKDMSLHQLSCTFGTNVTLCKHLYWHDCSFEINVSNLDGIFAHLETAHGLNSLTASGTGVVNTRLLHFFDSKGGIFCRPLYIGKSRNKILFVAKTDPNYFSWFCFDANPPGSTQTGSQEQLSLEMFSAETPTISWKLPVFPIMEIEERLKNPMVKVCRHQLDKLRRQGQPSDNHYRLKFK